MKMNAKNYLILRRAITAKQFESFVGIRTVQDFFDKLSDIETEDYKQGQDWKEFLYGTKSSQPKSSVVKTLLNEYLPSAAAGDLSFFEDPEFQNLINSIPIDAIPSGYEKDKYITPQGLICNHFQDYAKYYHSFVNFKKAEDKLSACAEKRKNNSIRIIPKEVRKYHAFMQAKGGELRKFDDYNHKHTSVMIGKIFYELYRDAKEILSEIDPDAIKSKAFSDITLGTFGANISGYAKLEKFLTHKEQLESYTDEHYSPVRSEIADSVYSSLRFTGQSQKIARTIAAVLVGGVLIGGTPALAGYQHAMEYNNITIYNAAENGYKLNISEATLIALKSSRIFLESIRSSEDFPSIEDFLELRNQLDANMDIIFSDLITPAFEKANPKCKVTNVETRYDLGKKNPEDPQRWIAVEYRDEHGDIQTERVSSFDTKNPVTNIFNSKYFNKYSSVYGTFDAEINLDEHFYTLLSQYKNATTFEEKTAAANQLIDFLDTTLQAEEIIGAKQVNYKNGILSLSDSVSLDLSEKEEVTQSEETIPTPSETTDLNHDDKDDDLSL